MAIYIFQVEVQNTMDSVGCWDIVPFKPYDSSILVVNQAPFLWRERDEPKNENASPKNEEDQDVSNEEALSQLFISVDNALVDKEEESHEDEIQMFHQRAIQYNLRGKQVGGPFTTST